jgi:DNA adenine methylase
MKNLQTIPSTSTRSLLRYPGSKARLAPFIAQTLLLTGYKHPVFVEPFCGGASVSIALLESKTVEAVVLNDVDPLVASLWRCVFSKKNAEWLAEAIMKVPLTLEYWQFQKNHRPTNVREAALKCLFLNRTSFSGLLHKSAGPMGGRAQTKWTIGCRFNREKLFSRILELSHLSSHIKAITQQSWKEVCRRWSRRRNIVFYLDPPFYYKAERLYRYVFDDVEHRNLCDYLSTLKSPWVLSYDNADKIRQLYDKLELRARIVDNTYSAHPIGGNSFVGREVIYSNLTKLPQPLRNNSNHIGLSVREFDKNRRCSDSVMRIPMTSV